MSNETTVMVGLGEVKVTDDPETVLACLGLGSCIAISVFDPVVKVGGMAHVVLPKSNGKTGDKAARYADIAVPLLIGQMRERGALDVRLQINLVGGAQMSLAPGMGTAFKIGEDNIAAVQAALKAEGLRIKSEDTGGNRGRTMRLFIESGKAMVASAGQETKEL
ncbi:MAG: chemotaxis protein CheD [SAR202 cluster bacterium]|nr:chemotaxis protein CheD [SAR202 cluster bacterium]